MLTIGMGYWAVAVVVAYFILNYISIVFIEKILGYQTPNFYFCSIIGLFNSVILCVLTLYSNTVIAYICVYIIFMLEFSIRHRRNFAYVLFLVTTIVFHIMVVRGIILCVFALVTGNSLYQVCNDYSLLLMSTFIVEGLLTIYVLLLQKYFSVEKVRAAMQHDVQRNYLITWMLICNIYLIFSAQIFALPYDDIFLTAEFLFSYVTLLLADYIFLLYAFRMNDLLGYKSINEQLTMELENHERYLQAMTSNAIESYEANLTRNYISSTSNTYSGYFTKMENNYEKMIILLCTRLAHPDDKESLMQFCDRERLIQVFDKNQGVHTKDYRRKFNEDEYRWTRLVINTIEDSATEDIRAFAYVVDVHEEVTSREALNDKVLKDIFTETYNKHATENLVSEELKKGKGILFIVDVDNFKQINDHFGHDKGDEVLKELANHLKSIFRSEDIVGRIGGDEFMVYVKDTDSQTVARMKAKEVCNCFTNQYIDDKGREHKISSSIGITLITDSLMTFEEVYRQADRALYHTKNHGKNGYTIYQIQSESA